MTAAVTAAAARPSGEEVLRLDGVHVVHKIRSRGLIGQDSVYALTDADLTLHAGESVGVVGESGCGKSTLARVLVGLQKPTQGRVLFRDTDLWAMPSRRRATEFGSSVAMVFQDPATALNRRLSVGTIVADPLVVHRIGTPETRRARVAELMGLVGLPPALVDARPAQLSGGQRQRVAIARALALEPQVLVADEPTSALDVSVRAQVLTLLMGLRERLGLAVVFVSHDIQTVRRVSDRVVTMYLGRIVEQSPAADIPDAVRHPYTRALFSATPSLLEPTEPITLTGPVPSAVHPPSGCPFRTRCWKATDECAAELPPLTSVPDTDRTDHTYRCWHPESGALLVGAPPDTATDAPESRTSTTGAQRP